MDADERAQGISEQEGTARPAATKENEPRIAQRGKPATI
jgi:hypothetical protein